MTVESFPEAGGVAREALFYDDGSLNEAVLHQRFGIGIEEANQPVSFGQYNGTVAQMLADEKCPVGDMVASAYKEDGIKGVENKFNSLGQLDSRFNVKISPTTLEREHVKKK